MKNSPKKPQKKSLSCLSKKLSYYHDYLTNKSLLSIILDVHMVHSGAEDFYPNYFKDVSLLRYAHQYWHGSSLTQRKFDTKVKELLKQVLEDHLIYVDKMKLYAEESFLQDEEYFLK